MTAAPRHIVAATTAAGQDQPHLRSEVALAAVTLVLELTLLVALLTERLTLTVALLLHGIVVAGLATLIWQRRRSGSDTGTGIVYVLAVALAGPAAAVTLPVLKLASRQRHEDGVLLQAWYDRLAMSTTTDPVRSLSDQISIGRALDTSSPPPPAFARVMAGSAVSHQQTVLGLIARRFHPDHLPALRTALTSPEPLIRVQAAAVAARLRDEVDARVRRLIAAAGDPAATTPLTAAQWASDIQQCLASGLVETALRADAEAARATFQRRAMDGTVRSHTGILRPSTAPALVSVIEAHWLASGDYTSLRQARRSQAWAARGPWTWRPRRHGGLPSPGARTS